MQDPLITATIEIMGTVRRDEMTDQDCEHGHRSVRPDRIGLGGPSSGPWPRLWLVVEPTAAYETTGLGWDEDAPMTIEQGTRLRLDASDYSWVGPEFGPGIGWHRFYVLDGLLADRCVVITVDDPLPPPDSLMPLA